MSISTTNIELLPLGIYRHYKGGSYRVIGYARDEASAEILIIYEPLEPTGALPNGVRWWARRLNIFKETVSVNGISTPRFSFVTDKDETH